MESRAMPGIGEGKNKWVWASTTVSLVHMQCGMRSTCSGNGQADGGSPKIESAGIGCIEITD